MNERSYSISSQFDDSSANRIECIALYISRAHSRVCHVFRAYVSVELSVMSVAFNLDMPTLERTLAELIQENKIAARIDSHKKILHARHSDQRNDTFTQALTLGSRYVRDVRSVIMRLSLVEHDLAVRSADSKKGKGRGGQGGAAGGQRESKEEELFRQQMEATLAASRR